MVFQGSFKEVSRKFQECFKKVSIFQESLKGVSWKIGGYFKGVFSGFKGYFRCFKGVSMKFQGFSMKVFEVLQGSFRGVTKQFKGCFKED